MAPAQGKLVPITRELLKVFYEQYPLTPVPRDITDQHLAALKAVAPADASVESKVGLPVPSRVDDCNWRSRMYSEETAHSLDCISKALPASQQAATNISTLQELRDMLNQAAACVEQVQKSNTESAATQIKKFLPQDFRGSLVAAKQHASEAHNRKAIEDLVRKGGTIRQKYELYLKQQWERREALVQMGNLSGVFRILVKYLGGVPQVLLDFAKQINAPLGPMEEQRLKYGPEMYTVCELGNALNVAAAQLLQDVKHINLDKVLPVLQPAVIFYCTHLKRVVEFLGEIFIKSPFFITADVAERGSLYGGGKPAPPDLISKLSAASNTLASEKGIPSQTSTAPYHDGSHMFEQRHDSGDDLGCSSVLLAAVGIHAHGARASNSGTLGPRKSSHGLEGSGLSTKLSATPPIVPAAAVPALPLQKQQVTAVAAAPAGSTGTPTPAISLPQLQGAAISAQIPVDARSLSELPDSEQGVRVGPTQHASKPGGDGMTPSGSSNGRVTSWTPTHANPSQMVSVFAVGRSSQTQVPHHDVQQAGDAGLVGSTEVSGTQPLLTPALSSVSEMFASAVDNTSWVSGIQYQASISNAPSITGEDGFSRSTDGHGAHLSSASGTLGMGSFGRTGLAGSGPQRPSMPTILSHGGGIQHLDVGSDGTKPSSSHGSPPNGDSRRTSATNPATVDSKHGGFGSPASVENQAGLTIGHRPTDDTAAGAGSVGGHGSVMSHSTSGAMGNHADSVTTLQSQYQSRTRFDDAGGPVRAPRASDVTVTTVGETLPDGFSAVASTHADRASLHAMSNNASVAGSHHGNTSQGRRGASRSRKFWRLCFGG